MLLIAGVCAAAVWNDLPPSERKQKKKKKMTTSSYTSVGSEMTLGGPLDAPDYRAASAYASSSTLWERPGGTPVGTPPPRTVVNSARDWDGLGRLEPAHVGQ